MKSMFTAVLAGIGMLILVACGGSSVKSDKPSANGGNNGTVGAGYYTDTISAQKIGTVSYGNKDIEMFKVDYDKEGKLGDYESSKIIMSDGQTETEVSQGGSHLSSAALSCNKLGGDPSQGSALTDNRVSYVCDTHHYKYKNGINIVFEKGKQYSFLVRYYDKNQVKIKDSEVQIVLEYGDGVLSIQQ